MGTDGQTVDGSEKLRPEIIVDGVVSDEKCTELLAYNHEEERLDYKISLDLSSKSAQKRSRIELACDLVAMANTFGGYIIIGVSENSDGTFTTVGATDENLEKIDSENILSWVSNYVDASLRIKVRTVPIADNLKVKIIFVDKYRLPVVFNRDGNFQDPNATKVPKPHFRSCDLYVRHGAKSEKATLEDWKLMVERIRQDERTKVHDEMGQNRQITDRLDVMISLLGGTAPGQFKLDLLAGTDEDLENRTFQLLSAKNDLVIRRTLGREFEKLFRFVKSQQEVTSKEELDDNLERDFISVLKRFIPVWATMVEFEDIKAANIFVDFLHDSFCRFSGLNFAVKNYPAIWFQEKIILLVYCLAAVGIMKSRPMFVKPFFRQGIPFDEDWRNDSWFEYTAYSAHQLNDGQDKSVRFCRRSFEFAKGLPSIAEYFEDEHGFLGFLCQFDFLRCVELLLRPNFDGSVYPNFMICRRKAIEPIIEAIINTYSTGAWIRKTSVKDLTQSIAKLESYVKTSYREYGMWINGEWDSRIIKEFISRYTHLK